MFDKIIDMIINAKSMRVINNIISKNNEYMQTLNGKFPLYKDEVSNITYMIRRGFIMQKVCKQCNGKLNDVSKTFCSKLCGCKYQKDNNLYTDRSKKSKDTCIERYGVSNVNKLKEIHDKRLKTMVEKYGAKVSDKTRESARSRTDNLNIKGRQTLKEKYGINNPGQMKDHANKMKSTNLQKYGNEVYANSDEAKEILRLERIEKFKEILINKATVYDVIEGTIERPNYRIDYRCNHCGNIEKLAHETFKWRMNNYSSPCPVCTNLNKGSLKESQLYEYITSIYNGTIVRNDRSVLNGKEIDILLPDLKIGIEFNGLFWHNDLRIDKNEHRNKYLKMKELGYRLITIFEDEWDYKHDIVKSKLYNLICTTKSIYARNITIKEINNSIAKEFIDKNHIQGYAISSIKLGLYNKDILCGVMTFSKLSKSKGSKSKIDHWEVSRYCTNIRIIGGFSKVFSYFVKTYNPEYVISYSDLRWGEGNSYSYAGFKYTNDTNIGYWYILNGKRIHRFALRKNSNDNPNLTEYENRLSQGYYRVWDCGNAKWQWKKGT